MLRILCKLSYIICSIFSLFVAYIIVAYNLICIIVRVDTSRVTFFRFFLKRALRQKSSIMSISRFAIIVKVTSSKSLLPKAFAFLNIFTLNFHNQ